MATEDASRLVPIIRYGVGFPVRGGNLNDLYLRSDAPDQSDWIYQCTAGGVRGIAAWSPLVTGGGGPATTVTGPDAFGAAAVVGTSTDYARQDHDHGLPAKGDLSSIGVFAVAPTETGTVASTPPSSASVQAILGNLSLGSAWQNTGDYDVWLTVYLAVTAATSLVIADGVGTTNTPVQTTIVSSTSATGIVPIRAKVPAGYYRLLSTSGTQTSSIKGQYLEAA